MEHIEKVPQMQALAEAQRRAGKVLALVPTMGALHEGHLALIEEARRRADHIIVSIFVNPTQFAPGEDFERYPRQLAQDLKVLHEVGGVDAIFAPSVQEMYPSGFEVQLFSIQIALLNAHLCGPHRPGHFEGVATVVTRLFHCCRPHLAVFGRKDAQQLVILQRLVQDFHFGIEIVGVPIIREPDGLALSSRNVYLNAEERRQAVVLSQAVAEARRLLRGGEQRPARVVEAMRGIMAEAPDAEVQYAEVVDAEHLQPLAHIEPAQRVLAAVAVFFGKTRLIDNAFVTASAAST